MAVARTAGESRPSTLRAEYSFERFVAGKGNRLACLAAQAVAKTPGQAYNPLFLHGPVGLGKTHLLHAIGNHVLKERPERRVIYVTSERFAVELVGAIRQSRTDHFRRTFRSADVLLFDDVHFLKDKEGTQEELFHTFNELHEGGRQIVLSSDRPPEELFKLQERLVSRFRWGLVADLNPPDFETRLAILRAKARESELEPADAILKRIAELVHSSVRALEGALIRVTAYADLQGQELTPELLDRLLSPEAPEESPPGIEAIKAEVARRYGLTVEQLEGGKREKRLAQARHIAIYLARELTQSSYPAIGRAFGHRDHTTVMHAYRKVRDRLKTPPFQSEIEALRAALCDRR